MISAPKEQAPFMTTVTPESRRPDAAEVFENYRGHRIGNLLKPYSCKNPISGHEWTEHQMMPTLRVSGPSNFSWTSRTYRSLKAAQRDIDYAIRYDARYQLALPSAKVIAIVRDHFALERIPSTMEIEDLVVSLRSKIQDHRLDAHAELLCIRLGMMEPQDETECHKGLTARMRLR